MRRTTVQKQPKRGDEVIALSDEEESVSVSSDLEEEEATTSFYKDDKPPLIPPAACQAKGLVLDLDPQGKCSISGDVEPLLGQWVHVVEVATAGAEEPCCCCVDAGTQEKLVEGLSGAAKVLKSCGELLVCRSSGPGAWMTSSACAHNKDKDERVCSINFIKTKLTY
jgi:hypothetical protein